MKKKIITIIFMLSVAVFAKPVDEIIFITEDVYPFNFKENGKLQGMSVDILMSMLQKLDSNQLRSDILMLPWNQGYSVVQKKKNTSLFSTTRTKEREKLFKWVGPITPIAISLIAKKDRHIKIRSFNEINKYKIGAVKEGLGEQILHKLT